MRWCGNVGSAFHVKVKAVPYLIYSASSELEKSTPLCSSSLIKDMFQYEISLLLAKVELPMDWPILRHSAVRSSLIIYTDSEAPPHNICEHLPLNYCYAAL